jgi:hypothetical protein
MSEVETQLRDYFEAMVERISAEDVLAERRVLRTTTQPTRRGWSLRPVWAAVAGFVGTIVVLGGWLGMGALLGRVEIDVGSGAITETLTETGDGVFRWWLVIAAAAITIGIAAAFVANYRFRRTNKEDPMKASTEGPTTERTTSARRHAMQTQDKQEVQSGSRKVWLIAALTVLVLAMIGVGIWALIAANQTDDIDVATDLVDDWLAAWIVNDPEAVAAVFTEDGILIGSDGETATGRDEILSYTGSHSAVVLDAERTGDLTATEAGTFTFPMQFDWPPAPEVIATWVGVVEIELDGDLASRIEWLEGRSIGSSAG